MVKASAYAKAANPKAEIQSKTVKCWPAARAFGLGASGVDLLRSETGPKVLELDSDPGLEGIEGPTGKDIVGLVYGMIETRVKPKPTQRRA